MNSKSRLVPLLLAVAVVLGIAIGTFYTSHFSGKRLNIINTGSNKLNYLLQIIDNNYVDTINTSDLIESAMPQILSELDPHSSYISADEAEESVEELKGSFSGIGVRFTVQNDTVTVMNIIKGGPSERVGVLPGDRIIAADDSSLIAVSNHDIIKRLRGPKHSKVRLTVIRRAQKQPLHFTVMRDDVPVESVDASFMLDDQTGYIAIQNFGETTYPEMLTALAQLNAEGMRNLIIDLRGNRGGYMQTAILIANEFLPAGELVVYTEGRRSPREDYRTDGHGSFQKMPLVILVDEISASASEILAGAIQDNDRGTIIGRRTFGKGLVQQPIEFKDHSIVRLTIARYYTPSGRCIQKPYVKGHDEDYENELIARYERGEFFSADSIHQDGPEYHTRLGRVVYGGGGIMPDIFVPEDTTLYTSYFREAVYNQLTIQFALDYTERNRDKLSNFKSVEQFANYLEKQNIVEQFANYAQEHGLKRRNLMIQRSFPLINKNLIANIIYNVEEQSARLQYLAADDKAIKQALDIFKQNKAFPTANDKK
ncbi:MAG: PDZ domain-containing protein [Bacteroidaceae bacterium]|nr:PDZ domain-containing protein [Bacteroidaceae bacterium]MBQ7460777.1 PDZ domain-containing protein [Bacteroidaceae bacterium]